MRISDWSSDVCSSDLLCESGLVARRPLGIAAQIFAFGNGKAGADHHLPKILAINRHHRNRAPIACAGRKLDDGGLVAQGSGGEILRGLAALPASIGALAKLPALEREIGRAHV